MYLINDHDGAHGADFGRGAARLGIQSIHTRSQAPQVNAVAERVVRTLRRECLDHLIVFDERHLLSVLQEFAAYYKEDRPDRTLAGHSPTQYSLADRAEYGRAQFSRPTPCL